MNNKELSETLHGIANVVEGWSSLEDAPGLERMGIVKQLMHASLVLSTPEERGLLVVIVGKGEEIDGRNESELEEVQITSH